METKSKWDFLHGIWLGYLRGGIVGNSVEIYEKYEKQNWFKIEPSIKSGINPGWQWHCWNNADGTRLIWSIYYSIDILSFQIKGPQHPEVEHLYNGPLKKNISLAYSITYHVYGIFEHELVLFWDLMNDDEHDFFYVVYSHPQIDGKVNPY